LLTLAEHSGRQVCNTQSRVCLVHMLTACPGRSVCGDAEVVRVDLYLRLLCIVQLRHDLDQCERRVPAVILVERGNSDKAMDAVLGAEQTIGAATPEDDGGAPRPTLPAPGGVP